MAKSKEDREYAAAQARLSDDEALRVRYKAGTPLEGGKIADSDPVDLFAGAANISKAASDDRTISASEPVDLYASARGVSSPGGSTKDEQHNMPKPSSGGGGRDA